MNTSGRAHFAYTGTRCWGVERKDDAEASDESDIGQDCVPYAIVLNTAATFTSPEYGGGGGGPFTVACPAGAVGVGLSGTAGGWQFGPGGLWNVGIECQSLLGDGSLAGAVSKVGNQGTGTTGYAATPFLGICAGGEMLSAMNGTWPGYVVNRIGFHCTQVIEQAI